MFDHLIGIALKIAKFVAIPQWIFIGVMAINGVIAAFEASFVADVIILGIIYIIIMKLYKIISTTEKDAEKYINNKESKN